MLASKRHWKKRRFPYRDNHAGIRNYAPERNQPHAIACLCGGCMAYLIALARVQSKQLMETIGEDKDGNLVKKDGLLVKKATAIAMLNPDTFDEVRQRIFISLCNLTRVNPTSIELPELVFTRKKAKPEYIAMRNFRGRIGRTWQ